METGVRDANLDNGWLLHMPEKRKLFCQTCDKWHDTVAQLQACSKQRKQLLSRATHQAKREIKDKTVDLETQVSYLNTQMAKLMAQIEKLVQGEEIKHGKVLQSTDNESVGQVAAKQSPRRRKKGL